MSQCHFPSAPTRKEYILLALLPGLISISALVFYYHQNALLLYGDAVAHINIARRVFDSKTPGYLQLGTVWLPFPHVLTIPFVINNRLWRTGIGPAIPSMIAYIAGTIGVFRLVRLLAVTWCAWLAAAIYALNPNLIYIQATGMTESLYLALLIWTIVYFAEFCIRAKEDPRTGRRSLEKCALVLAAAMMTRYDAWFLAALLVPAAFIAVWKIRLFAWPVRNALIRFMLLISLMGTLWLAYNYHAYGNALEFANGPYSARAIQEHSRTPTMQTYPGENSPRTAALYFLKVSRLTLGDGSSQKWLMGMGFIGLLCWLFFERSRLPILLLWSPVVFYTLCIAWASVPIYVPNWWPFSYYNTRYGLQMLPAVAVGCGLFAAFLGKYTPKKVIIVAVTALLVWSYAGVWGARPIVLREATVNSMARVNFERRLAADLKKLPDSATLMMDCGAYSGAVQSAGIPFRRVLRESNPPYWEEALAHPARSADYVIAINQDPVARAVHANPEGLEPLAEVGTPGGSRATIYRSRVR